MFGKHKVKPPADPFQTAFRAHFRSLLSWKQFDAFWETLAGQNHEGWYLYAIGEALPDRPAEADAVTRFLSTVHRLLHDEHDEDYCGIVYTDSMTEPTLIKIFDPCNLGVSCGYSDNPPLPGWVMSRLKPSLLKDRRVLPENRKRLWRTLFPHAPPN